MSENINFIPTNIIYHISDIHIREDFYDEINYAFDQLLEKINEDQFISNSLIVIAGDIFHFKNRISNSDLKCFNTILNKIKHIRTIIIPGNHDFDLSQKSNPNYSDLITEATSLSNLNNIIVLSKSQIKKLSNFSNTEFHILSPMDNIIPSFENNSRICRIAILHEPIKGCRNYSGTMNVRFSINDLNAYNIVLAGDMHKSIVFGDLKNIGYPGSIIQQNKGEDIKHGFLKWSINTKNFSFKTEFICLPLLNAFIIVNYNDKKLSGPSNIYFKNAKYVEFNCYDSIAEDELEEIKDKIIKKYGKIDSLNLKQLQSDIILNNLIPDDLIILSEFLKNNPFHDKIIELHKKYLSKVSIEKTKNKWALNYLYWSNLFCYGENNFIDFRNISGIWSILGRNKTGKSSVIDILVFVLFDEYLRSSKQTIMNFASESYKVYCCITISSVDYIIYREKILTLKTPIIRLFKMENERYINITDISPSATFDKIKNMIGTIDDLLDINVSIQENINISNKKLIEITNMFQRFFNLERFSFIETIIKKKLSNIRSLIKKFGSLRYPKEITEKVENFDKNTENYEILLCDIEKYKQKIHDLYNSKIPEHFITIELYPEQTKESIENLNKKLILKKSELKKLSEKFNNLKIISNDEISSQIKSNENEIFTLHSQIKHTLVYSNEVIQFMNHECDGLNRGCDDTKPYCDDLKLTNFDVETIIQLYKKIKSIDKTVLLKKIEELNIEKSTFILHKLTNFSFQEILNKKTKEKKVDIDKNKISSKILELNNKLLQTSFSREEILNCPFSDLETLHSEIKKIENINNNLKDAKSSITLPSESLEKLLKLKDNLNSLIQSQKIINSFKFNDECSACLENKAKRRDISDLSNKIEKVNEKIKLYEDYNNENTKIFTDWKTNSNKLIELEKYVLLLQDKSNHIFNKKIRKEIESLEILNDYYFHLDLQRNDEINTEISNLNLELLKIDENNKIIHDLQYFKKEYLNNEKNQKRNDKIQNKIKILEERNIYFKLILEINQIEQDIKIKELNETIINNKNKHKELINKNSEIDNQINELTNKLSEMEKEKNILFASIHNIKEMKQVVDEYQLRSKELNELIIEEEIYAIYLKTFSSKGGIPYLCLKECCKNMESRVNEILTELTDFKISIDFEDDFIKISIIDSRIKIPIKQGSGFQKFIIDLSIRMCLLGLKNEHTPDFLIIDEGFSCMDHIHLNKVKEYIIKLSNMNIFKWMIFISHNEDLQMNTTNYFKINIINNKSKLLYGEIPKLDMFLNIKDKKFISNNINNINNNSEEIFEIDCDDHMKVRCIACNKSIKISAKVKHSQTSTHLKRLNSYYLKQNMNL